MLAVRRYADFNRANGIGISPVSDTFQNLCRAITALLLVIACLASSARADGPAHAPRYHYDDISRFFAAYDRFKQSGDPADFAPYFEQGTKGMKNFEEHFGLNQDNLAETVQKYAAFFESIRNLEAVTRSKEKELEAMFERLQAMFPGYDMPSVYFVVGGLRAGGQAGDGNYVMVAAEVYTSMPGVDRSEFKPGARKFTPDDLVHIVAHEAAHVIQEEIQGAEQYLSIYTQPEKGTLMAYSLREGAANLVAKLVSGGHINEVAEAYGEQHIDELWPLFQAEAMGTELGDWFFYRPKKHPEWPWDLGYWMGYRMGLECYESADDKQAMLLWILRAEDPAAFMEECALLPPETTAAVLP